MAEKDLVYYKQWIPAWHQMDKYSANPWCLFSKNVDIFSSSNSYKATAFSTPSSQWSDIVDMDERWRIVLKSNWDVVDTWNNNEIIFNVIDSFDNIDSWVKVDYKWPDSKTSSNWENLVFWTPQKLLVKYNWDEWEEIVVFSDRIMFQKTRVGRDIDWNNAFWSRCTTVIRDDGSIAINNITRKNFTVNLNIDSPWFNIADFDIYYTNSSWSTWTLNWSSTPWLYYAPYMNYDAPSDSMVQYDVRNDIYLSWLSPLVEGSYVNCRTPAYKNAAWFTEWKEKVLELHFTLTTSDTIISRSLIRILK